MGHVAQGTPAGTQAVGGACGLALLGSATSDIAGFLVIALSPMGLFANFGIFSAAMIALSLFASLVLTTAALGLISTPADNDSTAAAEATGVPAGPADEEA